MRIPANWVSHPVKLLKRCFFMSVLVLAGCSAVPETQVNVNDAFYLKLIDSYAIKTLPQERLDAWQMTPGRQNHLEYILESSLDAQGLQLVPEEQASVWVYYYIVDNNPNHLFDYNRSLRACYNCSSLSYRSGKKYEPGTLIIDLVDPKTSMSVWRGVALRTIKEGNSEQDNFERVIASVRRLINQLFTFDMDRDISA